MKSLLAELFFIKVFLIGYLNCHGHTIDELAKPNISDIWLYSLLSTALISAAPVLVIFLIPDLKNHNSLLKILLAFAAGGLLGDAFLHLIPHAVSPHSHSDSHAHSHDHSTGNDHHMTVGLWVVAGILSFLCVEKFVRLVKGEHGHTHGPSIATSKKDGSISKKIERAGMEIRRRKSGDTTKSEQISEDEDKSLGQIKVAGYLNLVADFAHNFTDGLAIGASFLVNKNVGIVTTITILFHEVPHEIGDYAILIQSGCSRKKAIVMQLFTAIGAMLGTVISLVAGDFGSSSNWILPYTAGGFIYIATVTVIPELLDEQSNDGTKEKAPKRFLQTLAEILALCVGVGMMIVIAYYE